MSIRPLVHFISIVSLNFLALDVLSSEKIYVWTLPDGSKIFSDKPQNKHGKATESKDIDPSKTTAIQSKHLGQTTDSNQNPVINGKSTPFSVTDIPPEQALTAPRFEYTNCEISSPSQDFLLLPSESGNISVHLNIEPGLGPKHSAVVSLNNQTLRGAKSQFNFQGLYRGTYQVNAHIVNESGDIQCSASSIAFHVKRHIVRRN